MTQRIIIVIIIISKYNNINNSSKENERNCKTKIKWPMNGLCNLENEF